MKTLLTVSSMLILALGAGSAFGEPCKDDQASALIERMGPIGASAVCPEWEKARKEWNLRRDVPSIPVPQSEYRVRLTTTDRR